MKSPLFDIKEDEYNFDGIEENQSLKQLLSSSIKTQEKSLRNLYNQVINLEEQLRTKNGTQEIINGMNNVTTLQNAINGIAKSSVQSLKDDMSNVLQKSAVHSSEFPRI